MEPGLLIILKTIMIYASGPIIGLFAWVGKRLHSRVDSLEVNVSKLDKYQAVQQSQLNDIKEDVRQINKKLDKILDRVSQNNGS